MDASDDRTGEDLHDGPAGFGGGLGLHGDVPPAPADGIVNSEGVSENAAAENEQRNQECDDGFHAGTGCCSMRTRLRSFVAGRFVERVPPEPLHRFGAFFLGEFAPA
jgi:hypothetical protein